MLLISLFMKKLLNMFLKTFKILKSWLRKRVCSARLNKQPVFQGPKNNILDAIFKDTIAPVCLKTLPIKIPWNKITYDDYVAEKEVYEKCKREESEERLTNIQKQYIYPDEDLTDSANKNLGWGPRLYTV